MDERENVNLIETDPATQISAADAQITAFAIDSTEGLDMPPVSEEAVAEMAVISSKVENMLAHSIDIFSVGNYVQNDMDNIHMEEKTIDGEIKQYKDNHIKRLEKNVCTQSSGALFINMLNDLERVADHSANIAYSLRYQL